MGMFKEVKSQKPALECIYRGSKVKNNEGFTLLEVIVALAILSGVIITAIVTLNYHIGVTDRVKNITTATLLAKGKIEEINIFGAPSVNEGNFAPYFAEFHWTYRTEDTGFQGIKKISLTVNREKGEAVSIETYRRMK